MRYLDSSPAQGPLVGLANGPIVEWFLERHRDLVDYVEVPYEQLRHNLAAGRIQEEIPVVLHCSSMSIAGSVPPSEETLASIGEEAARIATPWIGEHLAFLRAEALANGEDQTSPVELTYTVCPQLSEETVALVAHNMARLRTRFPVPIILENSPQYFDVPGSTHTMPEFVAEVASRCDCDLLLDVTHFLITCRNMGLDPGTIHDLPLERVVEVHVSGMSEQLDRWWDDHAALAPEEAFELLADVAGRVRPRAVTVEYNWTRSFPEAVVVAHLNRIRQLLAA